MKFLQGPVAEKGVADLNQRVASALSCRKKTIGTKR